MPVPDSWIHIPLWTFWICGSRWEPSRGKNKKCPSGRNSHNPKKNANNHKKPNESNGWKDNFWVLTLLYSRNDERQSINYQHPVLKWNFLMYFFACFFTGAFPPLPSNQGISLLLFTYFESHSLPLSLGMRSFKKNLCRKTKPHKEKQLCSLPNSILRLKIGPKKERKAPK